MKEDSKTLNNIREEPRIWLPQITEKNSLWISSLEKLNKDFDTLQHYDDEMKMLNESKKFSKPLKTINREGKNNFKMVRLLGIYSKTLSSVSPKWSRSVQFR